MKSGRQFTFILLVSMLLVFFGLTSCVNNAAKDGQLGIQSLTPVQNQTTPGGAVVIESKVTNPGNAILNYKWSATGGGFGGSGANNTWQAPSQVGTYEITLTVEDGKGGTAQSKTSVMVSNNRPPAITGLSSDPVNAMPGGSTIISCIANDPDGDIIRYSWNASDGTVSGTGSKVSWISPSRSGDFGITCVVSDGKGGEAKQTVIVKVTPSGSNVTINLTKQESGTVSSTGEKDTTRYRSGDDGTNLTYRAFFTYDIFSLNKTNLKQAKIKFGPGKIIGDPFGGLTGLRIWKVSYGGGLPDYNVTGDNFYYAGGLLTSSPNEVDVTPEITSLIAAGADKFQLEALFYKASNTNNSIDYIEWPDVTLLITFNPY
jgi:hypothetical protein